MEFVCPFHENHSLFKWEHWNRHWCIDCKKWYGEEELMMLREMIGR